MSASHICPQCKGEGFRLLDGENSYIICECVEFDDADEADQQHVFMILHDALGKGGYDLALDNAKFCGQVLCLAQSAVKIVGRKP